MKKSLLVMITLLIAFLSFGQDYRQLFERSLEDNTKELVGMGFAHTNSYPNFNNLSVSFNFETFNENGHFENQILIYDNNGLLIRYSILTSNAEVYDMYFAKYSSKKLLANSYNYDFVYEDEQNLFAFAAKTLDEITFYSIEVFLLPAKDI
jgi:hypothetical protein